MNYESCGIIITDHNNLLICHPTNGKWKKGWSIPKGIREDNETTAEAAVRECFEETSFVIDKSDLVYIGTFPYRKDKDLCVFLYSVDEMIDINSLNCSSTFTNEKNKDIPEIDKFAIIHKSQILEYLNPEQGKIINASFSLI